MANYYVSNSGSPGSGSIGDPWGIPDLLDGSYAIGPALTTLVAGDTLFCRGGDYHITRSFQTGAGTVQILYPANSGTLGQPITIQSYPGEIANFILEGDVGQPLWGTATPVRDYIRWLGLQVTVTATHDYGSYPEFIVQPTAFTVSGTGIEIGYCEIIGTDVTTTDNHEGIFVAPDAVNHWIHHNNIHGWTAGTEPNSAGIKVYKSVGLIVEDNYIHDNRTGIHDKDSGSVLNLPIYRRNWLTGNTGIQFRGNNQQEGALALYYIYDNVIDGAIDLFSFNSGSQLYNNLIRTSELTPDYGKLLAMSGNGCVQLEIWNNLVLPLADAPVHGYADINTLFVVSGPTAQFSYMDYNVYTGTPFYVFGEGAGSHDFTLAQFQGQGFETNAIEDTRANIFVDEVAYVLKGVYPTAGRFGDQVGPRYSVASILDTTRYGPAAMSDPGTGVMAPTEGHDAQTAVAVFKSTATMARTESHDAQTAVAVFKSIATASPTEGHDAQTAVAVFKSTATIGVTAATDTMANVGLFQAVATMTATEAHDTQTAVGTFKSTATASPTEAHDTQTAVGLFHYTAALAGTSRSDTAAGVGTFKTSALFIPTAGSDSLAGAGVYQTPAALAGCLKITCDAGEKWMARVTTTFATLQNKTACSFSFWIAIDAMDDGGGGLIAVTGSNNPIAVGGTLATPPGLSLSMKNAAGTTNLTYSQTVDVGNGHFIVMAYDGTLSTLYDNGVAVATQAGQGATINSATNFRFGWDDGSHAITLRVAQAAFWDAETLTPAEVIRLRDRVDTPATLGRPASNFWSWQGTHGSPATIGSAGLNDSIGTNHFDSLPFAGVGSGTAVYDSSTITILPTVLFMTPYVDTTGYLLFVPLYLDALVSAGGPVKPTSVATDPVFTVAGSPAAATRLPLDSRSCFIAYQFDSQIPAGRIVTMSASLGWASTASGAVAGTAGDGLGSTPMACENYSTADTDFSTAGVVRTMKLGSNPVPFGGGRSSIGQVMANWARRIYSRDSGTGVTNWTGTGTVTAFDANNLPTTITGTVIATIDNSGNLANGIDDNGIPGTAGTWTLSYGDATTGVTSDPASKKITIDLAVGAASWTISLLSSDPGNWSVTDNCWHNIKKTYSIAYKSTGGPMHPIVQISVSTIGAGGAIQIPLLANGQSELFVGPPTYHGSTTSTPVTFEPMAVCPTYLAKVVDSYVQRWMPVQGFMTTTGSGNYTYASELSQRTPTEFLMTNQATTTLDVTRIDPVSDPTAFIVDYLNGDATGTLSVPTSTWTNSIRSRFLYLITTSIPHGLHTGYKYIVTSTSAARAAVIDWNGITLTAGVASSTSSTVIALNQTTSLNGASGSNLTVGTILQIGSGTSDEQVVITGPAGPDGVTISGLNVTVTRQTHGTTALAKPSGTVCYICVEIAAGGLGQAAYVVSPTQIFQFQQKLSIPSNIPDPTLLYGQSYLSGQRPQFTVTRPWLRPTMSYGHCAAATSAVAAANASGQCICWVCIPFMATDDAVTAAVNEMIPFLSAGVRLIIQCDNEVFNGQFDQALLVGIFATVAPNPETSGTGFSGGWNQYLASRQHHFNMLAKAAFTAAMLDPDRVLWGHNGHQQGGLTQPDNEITLAYCQTYDIPVDVLWTSSYADMSAPISTNMAATYLSWLPASTGVTGATGTWDLATTRGLIRSYYRAAMRFSSILGTAHFAAALSMSRYNNGLSVTDGVTPANPNMGTGRICTYEGATTLPLLSPFPGGTTPTFPECSAFSRDLISNQEWYWTEIAYYQAMQESPHTYAVLMGDKFPDADDAYPLFNCYYATLFTVVPSDNTIGYLYPQYMWQGQPAGYGDDNVMGWDPFTPVNHDMTAQGGILPELLNESVRGQAAIDWTADVTGITHGSVAYTEAADAMTGSAVAVGVNIIHGAFTVTAADDALTGAGVAAGIGNLAVTEGHDTQTAVAVFKSTATMTRTEAHDAQTAVGTAGISPASAVLAVTEGHDVMLTTGGEGSGYANPNVVASGTTFDQFQQGGLSGQIDRLITAAATNGTPLSSATIWILRSSKRGNLDQAYIRLRNLVANFNGGIPMPINELESEFLDIHAAFAVIATACAEIGALIDQNPGNFRDTSVPIGISNIEREWP